MENIQLTLFGRTSPEPLAVTKGRILGEFSKKSQKPKFQYLKMGNGQKAEWLNYQTVQSLGELSTLNIGAFPNVAVESTLSQILEVNAPQKYYLSPKACQGILRRAEKRGKELPLLLKAALEAQADGKLLVTSEQDFQSAGNVGFVAYAVGIQPNNSLSASGLSDIEEKSPTLSCTKKTGVAACYPINTQIVTRSNKLGEGTGMGIGEDGDPAYTLQEAHSHGVIYAEPVSFENSSFGGYKQGVGTLKASGGDYGGGSENLICQPCSYNSSGDDISGTLDASYYKGCGIRSGVEREFVATPIDGNNNFYVWIVRRLTPLECERLQGFPDEWTKYDTKGNEIKDTPRYKACGNSIAISCAVRVFQGILEIGKKG